MKRMPLLVMPEHAGAHTREVQVGCVHRDVLYAPSSYSNAEGRGGTAGSR